MPLEPQPTPPETLRLVIDTLSEGVIVANCAGEFLLWNTAAAALVGIGLTASTPSEWQARHGVFLVDRVTPCPDDQIPLSRTIRGESFDDVELFIRNAARPEGIFILVTGRPMYSEGKLVGGLVLVRDNSNARSLAEARTLADREHRMASLGRMAAGIAHEINSPLLEINLVAARIERRLADHPDPRLREALGQIKASVERAACIVGSVKRLVHGDSNPAAAANSMRLCLADIVADVSTVSRARCDLDETDFRVEAPTVAALEVRGSRSEIGQILANLVSNAFDAVSKSCRRPRWVEVRVEEQTDRGEVWLSVTDSGEAIPPAVRQRMFEPLYSTKPVGEGTGLGLAVSAQLAKNQGGRLVFDEDAPNTKFILALPTADATVNQREEA